MPASRARELKTIFEDSDVIVIDKPAGVSVHEGTQTLRRDSIIGRLESKYRILGIKPKLVHRLDRETSGILLVAKHDEVLRQLEHLFRTRQIHKEYLCLVAGRVHRSRGTLDFPLPGRQGLDVRAVTDFRIVKLFPEATLLRISTSTGRMHQIRLHFSRFGYPVVMDDQHGDFRFNKTFRKEFGLKRQFLHASSIVFPYRGKKQTFTAPLAPDLQLTLRRLESKSW